MAIAPIALFAFNRPKHLATTIEALVRNPLANKSKLYIYSDGPRTEKDLEAVNDVRKVISNVNGFAEVIPIIRETNMGLADSIASGVTQLMEMHGRCIVLEDDIVTSPFFLEYMNSALDFYELDEEVMHVSGFMPPIDSSSLSDTFFLRQASCWGWATWANRWQYFSRDSKYLLANFTKEMITEFNINDGYNYWDQVVANDSGKIKTWAVFWYANIFLKKGLCLNPKVSLVSNIGLDGSGENCKKSDIQIRFPEKKIEVIQEKNIVENVIAYNLFRQYFTKKKSNKRLRPKLQHKLIRLWNTFNFKRMK